MIGNVSDWLSYAGGALIKVADSAGSTVFSKTPIWRGTVFKLIKFGRHKNYVKKCLFEHFCGKTSKTYQVSNSITNSHCQCEFVMLLLT